MLNTDPRTLMMLQFLQNQPQTAPRRGEGLWRGLNALGQGLMYKAIGDDAQKNREAASQERQNAIGLIMGKPAETQTYGDGTSINWNEQKPNYFAASQAISMPENDDLRDEIFKAVNQRSLAKDKNEMMLELLKEKQALGIGGQQTPSAVQEYNFYKNLSPDEQKSYLSVKRQTLDPGISLTDGVATPIPGYQDIKSGYAQSEATSKEFGKQQGETKANVNAAEAAMPQLEASVKKLQDLGQKATYTTAGRGVDTARREAGLEPREGAVAREAYMAHVKNNILPLLRRTFGAQFTKAEGDSLLATLGDPNKAPAEKDATLRAFIEDKKATLETLKREAGIPPMNAEDLNATPSGGTPNPPGAFDIEKFLKSKGL